MTTTSARRETAATTDASQASSRLVASVAVLGLVALMVRVTAHASEPLSNADTWFHLRIGQEFWGDWSITNPGSLSSFATADWVPTQWSTQMLAAAMESWFGLPGVSWLFGFVYLVFIVVTYRMLRSQGALLPTALASGVVVVAAGPGLSARPQVVSLVLFTVATWAWTRAAVSGRPPWFLIPLTWVWATAHGLWTAGALLGVVVSIGIAVDHRLSARRVLGLVSVPVISVVAAALTPVGPNLLFAQLAVGERTPLIPEWGPTSFREVPAIVAALFVAALVVLWSRRHRVAWTPVAMLLLGSAWILTVDRMVAFGVIIVAPLFVRAFTDVMTPPTGTERPGRAEVMTVAGVAAACAVALAFVVPHTAQRPAAVPVVFSSSLADLPSESAVLVEDHIGSWIEWRFPELNPVVDGMFDAYPVAHLRQFMAFRSLNPGWQEFVKNSHASVAVLVDGSPLSAAMQAQLGWRVVKRTEGWVYMAAPEE